MVGEGSKDLFVFSKKGDGGTTSLLSGERISKADLRPEAYGTLDEASSVLGIVKAMTNLKKIEEMIEEIQKDLIILGAELAFSGSQSKYKISPDATSRLERWIEELQKEVPLPRHFVHPGVSLIGAFTDLARTIVRRAERRMVAIRDAGEVVSAEALSYINRLADFLFTLARYLDVKGKENH